MIKNTINIFKLFNEEFDIYIYINKYKRYPTMKFKEKEPKTC